MGSQISRYRLLQCTPALNIMRYCAYRWSISVIDIDVVVLFIVAYFRTGCHAVEHARTFRLLCTVSFQRRLTFVSRFLDMQSVAQQKLASDESKREYWFELEPTSQFDWSELMLKRTVFCYTFNITRCTGIRIKVIWSTNVRRVSF